MKNYVVFMLGLTAGTLTVGLIQLAVTKPPVHCIEILDEKDRVEARLMLEPKVSFALPMTNFTGKVVIK